MNKINKKMYHCIVQVQTERTISPIIQSRLERLENCFNGKSCSRQILCFGKLVFKDLVDTRINLARVSRA